MQRLLVTELSSMVGKKVQVMGWLYNLRSLGKLNFLLVRDRSGIAQVVVDSKSELLKLKALQPGSVLKISGVVNKTDKTDLGMELINPEITVVNAVTTSWPVEINKPDIQANIDTLLENRAITLRHPKQAAVFRIQGTYAQAYREYMLQNDFTEFFGPAMIASSSEGGAEIFKLDYFGREATLAQSNQLYKQMLVGVYERVFGLQKCFRAENSNTRRHLTEATQYEFELGFIQDISDIFVHIEGVIRHMLQKVREVNAADLELLGTGLVKVPAKSTFPRLTFKEAVKIYTDRTGEDTSSWNDLNTESERELCAYAREHYDSDFIIITNYPKGKFYAYKDENGEYHNFDVLCRDAEIISGGRRIDNYDKLVAAIENEGLNPDDFSEYLSIFKYGMPAHGGFGMGMERFTMLTLGLENIREAVLFPSDTKRVASQSLPEKKLVGSAAIKRAVKQLFVENDLEFSVTRHEATPTSDDSARVRDLPLSSGIKALILRDKKTSANLLVNIPADRKLDIKLVEGHYQKSHPHARLEFEKPEVINERFGLSVGGVPPFGSIFGVETWWDAAIFENKKLAFNNADTEESLICKGEDLRDLAIGLVADFTTK